jgi:hypothetical protein
MTLRVSGRFHCTGGSFGSAAVVQAASVPQTLIAAAAVRGDQARARWRRSPGG